MENRGHGETQPPRDRGPEHHQAAGALRVIKLLSSFVITSSYSVATCPCGERGISCRHHQAEEASGSGQEWLTADGAQAGVAIIRGEKRQL